MPETDSSLVKCIYRLAFSQYHHRGCRLNVYALATLQDNPSASLSPHQVLAPSHSALALFLTKAKTATVNVHTCSEEGAEPAQVPASTLTRTETAIDIMHTFMHQGRNRASSVVQFQHLAPQLCLYPRGMYLESRTIWEMQPQPFRPWPFTQTRQRLPSHQRKFPMALLSSLSDSDSTHPSKKKQWLSLGLVEDSWHLALAVAHLDSSSTSHQHSGCQCTLEKIETILPSSSSSNLKANGRWPSRGALTEEHTFNTTTGNYFT